MPDLRLLIDPPAAGAWNMAVDEALLETAATTGQATLRFYEWCEPTLSLGYFQSIADRQKHAASRDCPLVRRCSGGGAILHDRELTYSLTIPQPPGSISSASELCNAVHQTLVSALVELGIMATLYRAATDCRTASNVWRSGEPFLCFERRGCSDIVFSGAKIVGSAQRRRRGAVLQHGSILLGRSQHAPELPGIVDLAAMPLVVDELRARWIPRLADLLGLLVKCDKLSLDEEKRVENLVHNRFGAILHLQRR